MTAAPEPVDAVYTWVDDSRPGFAEALAEAIARERAATGRAPDPRAAGANRFSDNDCLRHSLRALNDHLPWIRRILIVTAGEAPAWLDTDHPRIRMVRHDEIFPSATDLPTFNSGAIEACLHLIPGLSRRFLYFNDDIFVLRDLGPGHFLDAAGHPRLRFERWQLPTRASGPAAVAQTAAQLRALLDRRFGHRAIRLETPHQAVLIDREIVEAMERDWPQQFRETRSRRLRAPTDLPLIRAYLHYALELRAGASARIELANDAFVQFGNFRADLARQFGLALHGNRDFLCINDERGEEGPIHLQRVQHDRALLAAFFERRFPRPAPWEVPPAAPATAPLAGL